MVGRARRRADVAVGQPVSGVDDQAAFETELQTIGQFVERFVTRPLVPGVGIAIKLVGIPASA